LQLAYFSMRYGLLPGLKPGEFYQKSYPAVSLGSTRKENRDGYFRHPVQWLPAGFLVRRRKPGKGSNRASTGRLARLPIQRSGSAVWFSDLVQQSGSAISVQRSSPFWKSKISAPNPPSISLTFGPGSP
jgi:hypothetical protein